MSYRLKLAISAAVVMASTGTAQAADVSQEVLIGSTVAAGCGLGSPDVTEINLGDLTASDGRLDASKTVTTTIGSATILSGWCNTAHRIRLDGLPMTLTHALAYSQPANMARKLAFTAWLVGWGNSDYGTRIRTGSDTALGGYNTPTAIGAAGLKLNISELQTLTAGNTEQAGLMLEAGEYRGTVKITLTPTS